MAKEEEYKSMYSTCVTEGVPEINCDSCLILKILVRAFAYVSMRMLCVAYLHTFVYYACIHMGMCLSVCVGLRACATAH